MSRLALGRALSIGDSRVLKLLDLDLALWTPLTGPAVTKTQTSGTGAAAWATDYVLPGTTRSLKLTSVAPSAETRWDFLLPESIDWSEYSHILVPFYWPSETALEASPAGSGSNRVYLSLYLRDGSWSHYHADLFGGGGGLTADALPQFHRGWNLAVLGVEQASKTGTPTRKNLDLVRLSFSDAGAPTPRPLEVHVAGVYAMKKRRPQVVFWADDSAASQYEYNSGTKNGMIPKANALNIPFTLATIFSDLEAVPGSRMSLEQVATLVADGNCLAVHDIADECGSDWLSCGTQDNWSRTINTAMSVASSLGVSPRFYAWPSGFSNDQLEGFAAASGFLASRGYSYAYTPDSNCGYERTHLGLLHPHRVFAVNGCVDGTAGVDSFFTNVVMPCIRSGSDLHLVFHGIRTTTYDGYWMVDTVYDYFLAKMSALMRAGIIDAVTAEEWYACLSGARINASTGRIAA